MTVEQTAAAQEKKGQKQVITDAELTGPGSEGKGEFIKSSNKYSLSTYWMPGTALVSGDPS